MTLTTNCQNCNEVIKIRSWAADRVELARTKGEYLEHTCRSCNKTQKYHVDSLHAKPSIFAEIVALSIFLIGTPLVMWISWSYIWRFDHYTVFIVCGILLTPITIYGLIQKDDRRRVNAFNRHKLKGH